MVSVGAAPRARPVGEKCSGERCNGGGFSGVALRGGMQLRRQPRNGFSPGRFGRRRCAICRTDLLIDARRRKGQPGPRGKKDGRTEGHTDRPTLDTCVPDPGPLEPRRKAAPRNRTPSTVLCLCSPGRLGVPLGLPMRSRNRWSVRPPTHPPICPSARNPPILCQRLHLTDMLKPGWLALHFP